MLLDLTKRKHKPLYYYPHIDGLRAIAVMSVVIHHIYEKFLPGGFIGVDVFFVISGYLITNIILKEIGKGAFSFIDFYERRIRRIFPALFGVLIFTLLGSYFILLPSDFIQMSKGLLGTLYFVSNVVFWRELQAGYFAAMDSALNPLVHTWSLAVEEQFYVFFPVLILLAYKFGLRKLQLIVFLLFLTSLFLAEIFVTKKPVATFFLSPFRIYELIMGAALALNLIPNSSSKHLLNLLSFVGVSLIIYSAIFFNNLTNFPGVSALIPTIGAVLVIYCGINGSKGFIKVLEFKILVYIGLISYSLYLWHWPIIVFFKYIFLNTDINFVNSLIIFIVCILVASFSYFIIEQPFRNKKFLTTRTIFLIAGILIAIFTFLAYSGISTSGYKQRYTSEINNLDLAREPEHTYKKCDQKFSIDELCIIGDKSSNEEVILFGDSHLMSWAPALNDSLKEKNKKGVLVMLSACPPLIDVYAYKSNKLSEECRGRSKFIKEIVKNTKAKEIVLSGYWAEYEKEIKEVKAHKKHSNNKNKLSVGLENTVEYLLEKGLIVKVIGPVPTYEKSVPLMLAKELITGKELFDKTKNTQLQKTRNFMNSVKKYKKEENFKYINPIEWICERECLVKENKNTLYFDSNHLNVRGSKKYKDNLTKALFE